jgi:hypothetical protein
MNRPIFVTRERKPLKQVDFKIIQEPLNGLLRNMDSDLQRRMEQVRTSENFEEYRQLMLLLIMLRFAVNSYQAVGFLLSDLDEHPKRLPRFVVVVPPINRQIMDLWFTLVYIMDDFGPRSVLYELGAYKELRKHIDDSRVRYGADPEWQDWFEDMQELSNLMETQLPLTADQKANPQSITSWPHPHGLSEKPSRSQSFLQFLHNLLYSETSVETHLKPAGLMVGAGVLLMDIAPDEIRKKIEERTIHQYKFRQMFRTVISLLGVVSEIEMYAKLGNTEQAIKIWKRMAEHNADAKDVYEARYKTTLG